MSNLKRLLHYEDATVTRRQRWARVSNALSVWAMLSSVLIGPALVIVWTITLFAPLPGLTNDGRVSDSDAQQIAWIACCLAVTGVGFWLLGRKM